MYIFHLLWVSYLLGISIFLACSKWTSNSIKISAILPFYYADFHTFVFQFSYFSSVLSLIFNCKTFLCVCCSHKEILFCSCNVVFQSAKRVCIGNYITSCSLFTQDELCNKVLNTNAKHECLIPLHKESWVKNEQRVM